MYEVIQMTPTEKLQSLLQHIARHSHNGATYEHACAHCSGVEILAREALEALASHAPSTPTVVVKQSPPHVLSDEERAQEQQILFHHERTSEAAAQPKPKTYSCCGAEFAKQHEPTCHNYTTKFEHDH